MSQHGCPERLSNRSKGFHEDGQNQPTIEVLVETLTGTAFEMTVSPTDTILNIKSKIFRVEGIPISQQHLLYNLKELDDSSSLKDYSISDGAKLRLVLGMRGGPISTRRLPPPQNSDPWRDIERLLDGNREEPEAGDAGCKVTVLVFRDGDRVRMLRVRENADGTYSPVEPREPREPREQRPGGGRDAAERERAPRAEGGRDNAVTLGKMLELRRRLDRLAVCAPPDMLKTRSEETLALPRLLDEPRYAGGGFGAPPLLLPAIAARADSAPSVADADELRLSLADAHFDALSASGRAFGSASALSGERRERGGGGGGGGHSGSACELAAVLAPPLPPLARHHNSRHLHLSDEERAREEREEREEKEEKKEKKRRSLRCAFCRKRLSVATEHACRCGATFCAPHRYAEVHGCAFDYKAQATPLLRRDNPLVSAPKLPKI